MKNRIILIVLLVLAGKIANAQDPHYSQYFTSPMTLNPALIGKHVDDWRLALNYRSQWWGGYVQPYNTTTASAEKRLLQGRNDHNSLAFGFSVLSESSNAGVLKNNYFTGGIAYNMALDAAGEMLLGGGLSVTYANRMLDASKFEFQSQYGSMGFQRTASNDPVPVNSTHYWDMNAGIHLSKQGKKWGYQLGASIYHVGSPEQGFYQSTKFNIDPRYSLQAGLDFALGNSRLYISSVADYQGISQVYTVGALYKLLVNDETIHSLNLGLWNRFGDAVYPYVGLEFTNCLLGISYDAVSSQVATEYNAVQSMEFSFVWQLGKGRKNSVQRKAVVTY
jgi:type IX secretion system PorP/SprF family membrane protein